MNKENGFVLVETKEQKREHLKKYFYPYLKDKRKVDSLMDNIDEVVSNNFEKLNGDTYKLNCIPSYVVDKSKNDRMLSAKKIISESMVLLSEYCEVDNINTYGRYCPSYFSYLQNQYSQKDKNYNSLLAGCLYKNSLHEYLATVKSVYPKAKCEVLDIEKWDHLEKNDFFKQGNVLNMSEIFPENSFDSIHTNYLLSMIENGDKSIDINTEKILNEFYRALKPGGITLLIEKKEFFKKINFHKIGFTSVTIPDACAISLKQTSDFFKRSVIPESVGFEVEINPGYSLIVAKK